MRIPDWLLQAIATIFLGASLAWAGSTNGKVITHDAQIVSIFSTLTRIEQKLDRVLELEKENSQ